MEEHSLSDLTQVSGEKEEKKNDTTQTVKVTMENYNGRENPLLRESSKEQSCKSLDHLFEEVMNP